VLGNDSDVDGGPLAVTAVSPDSAGVASLAGGVVSFTPAAGFVGTATFDYTVSDGAGGTDTATVTVTVSPVNDPPVAADDTLTVGQNGTSSVVDVLGNDSDVDGGPLVVTSVGPVSTVGGQIAGSVSLVNGVVTFIPAPGFSGIATFPYTVSDGIDSDTGLVTVTVTAPHAGGPAPVAPPPPPPAPVVVQPTPTPASPPPAIDPPSPPAPPANMAPDAVDDSVATGEGVPVLVDVQANDSAVDGDVLAVTIVDAPKFGTALVNPDGTVTYTPAPGFGGADSLVYQVCDAGGLCDTATVVMQVVAFRTVVLDNVAVPRPPAPLPRPVFRGPAPQLVRTGGDTAAAARLATAMLLLGMLMMAACSRRRAPILGQ
ncbi:MAG TPA: Ig-like domain-containing protein, partial [Mycobacteriales bacterium]|nr:Ig-like domain-containing protein [Mycobacteriales bacterium]